jgi:hypothetical protein
MGITVHQSYRNRLLLGRHLGRLSILTALLLVVGLAFSSPSARAAAPASAAPAATPSGDFQLTLSASDLGIAPASLQTAVNEVSAEDARAHVSLSEQMKRDVAEYGGDTSGWVETGLTMSMSSDGSAVTFTIPAAEVQTSQTWWQEAVGIALGTAAMFAVRGICISALTVSGIGAGTIPLVCTPLGGATGAFFQSVWQHYWDEDLGTADAWTDILIKTVAGALGGYLWEKYASPFFKSSLPAYWGNLGRWLQTAAPCI